MSDDDASAPGPVWELGDYEVRPIEAEADEPSVVPWRFVALLVFLALVMAAAAFAVVIAV